jgi:hypothetical protein
MRDRVEDADRVTLSRNETESLCQKAARGAGLSWGLAEEAGFATRWLAARGIDGTVPLLSLLNGKIGQGAGHGAPKPTAGHWQSPDGSPLCPIRSGAALVDHAALTGGPFSQDTLLDPVETPLLLLPFLARAAQICRRSLTIGWQGGHLRVTPDGTFTGLDAVAWAGPAAHALRIMPASDVDKETLPAEPSSRPSVMVATVNGLEALALKTTVPATEASRGGAGSATTDND